VCSHASIEGEEKKTGHQIRQRITEEKTENGETHSFCALQSSPSLQQQLHQLPLVAILNSQVQRCAATLEWKGRRGGKGGGHDKRREGGRK
jgi:hypothetical protein